MLIHSHDMADQRLVVIAKFKRLESTEGSRSGSSDRASSPIPPAPRPAKKINYEEFIGGNLFGKIGIFVLVVGIGLFVKYAINNE